MRVSAKRMAVCAMMTALSVVIMLIGAILELGIYAAPLLVGLCYIPIGQKYGIKYHWLIYAATSILCLLFVPNLEENLTFVLLFGWYPIVRTTFQKFPLLLRVSAKLLLFNCVIVFIQWFLQFFIPMEALNGAMLVTLLILGNFVFLIYDLLVPRFFVIVNRILVKSERTHL